MWLTLAQHPLSPAAGACGDGGILSVLLVQARPGAAEQQACGVGPQADDGSSQAVAQQHRHQELAAVGGRGYVRPQPGHLLHGHAGVHQMVARNGFARNLST